MHNVSETLLSAVGYTNNHTPARNSSPFDQSSNGSLKFANSSSSLESLSTHENAAAGNLRSNKNGSSHGNGGQNNNSGYHNGKTATQNQNQNHHMSTTSQNRNGYHHGSSKNSHPQSVKTPSPPREKNCSNKKTPSPPRQNNGSRQNNGTAVHGTSHNSNQKSPPQGCIKTPHSDKASQNVNTQSKSAHDIHHNGNSNESNGSGVRGGKNSPKGRGHNKGANVKMNGISEEESKFSLAS
jgi:hypothetical protein